MIEWIESHDNADGWFDYMYWGEVIDRFKENEPERYGFDWRHAYAVEMQRNYPVAKCEECGDVSDTKTCSCDCDAEPLEEDDAIEWWEEFCEDTGSVDEIVATSVLLEEGYPKFVEHFNLEKFFDPVRVSIDDFDTIEDAQDALVWFLKAAHLQHFGGFHLQELDGWREEDCWSLCDWGLQDFFGREVVEEFVNTFDLERIKLSPFELEEDEEAEDDLCLV